MKPIALITAITLSCLAATAQRKIKVNTAKAERTTHRLPDSTLIFLNAKTSISYPADFTDKPGLTLDGEIFVTWNNNQNKRFTVTIPTSPATLVSCLGSCSIDIMAYLDDSITKVSVNNGSVTIFTGTHMKVATAGKVATVQGNLITMISDTDYVQSDTSWINWGLHFQDWPLRLILTHLNRCIPYEFSIPDADMNEKIIATHLYGYPIDAFLRSINSIANVFSYHIQEKRIKITTR
jgi:transmembrane sensor